MTVIPKLQMLIFMLLACLPLWAQAASPQLEFARQEIRKALEEDGRDVRVVITESVEQAAATADRLKLKPLASTRWQSYSLRRAGDTYVVLSANPDGAMYGGLDLAEAIRTGSLGRVTSSDHSPRIERRGIKFNIPLDMRTPSYSDVSFAGQANIPVMWDMEFWHGFIDDMARYRYNALTVWSLHPFPSMVKVPEFPDVALDDVHRSTLPVDQLGFSLNGRVAVTDQMLETYEVVKEITIDEKIDFWREVMAYADSRGVEFYVFTWNIFTFGAGGKHGIATRESTVEERQTDDTTMAYFRASVRELVDTYPSLDGIGVTAGEQMKVIEGRYSKERWLRDTYGAGVEDALKDEPERPFRFIHRTHQAVPRHITGGEEWSGAQYIAEDWADFDHHFEISFKYAQAHMYSHENLPFIKETLPYLSPNLRTWLTVRNDDVYSFDWGDPDFVRRFINGMPGEDKVAGIYIGPDGYIWGREFLSKREGKRRRVSEQQWYMFLMWGYLAYDPKIPDGRFKALLAEKYPGVDRDALFEAMASASRVYPLTTSFFWRPLDFQWIPEFCFGWHRAYKKIGYRGFYDIKDFMNNEPLEGAGVQSIANWVATCKSKPCSRQGVRSPLDVAAGLEASASRALELLTRVEGESGGGEWEETVNDIRSMSLLGLYYAAKIRGAANLAKFIATGEGTFQESSVGHLKQALQHWDDYTAAYTELRRQPLFWNRHRWIDLRMLRHDVAKDIAIAQQWEL
jgi:hypothetical protein